MYSTYSTELHFCTRKVVLEQRRDAAVKSRTDGDNDNTRLYSYRNVFIHSFDRISLEDRRNIASSSTSRILVLVVLLVL